MTNRFPFLFIITAIWFGTLHAQNLAPPINPDSALKATLDKLEGEPLRLQDVVGWAMTRSTQAQDAQGALAAARGALMKQRGVHDPELFAEYYRSSEKQPSASPFSGAAVVHPEISAGEVGARITLPTGTELSAAVTGQKLETNSAFSSLNPEYDATASLTFRQPLLQGLGPGTWGDLEQAKKAYAAAQERYEDTMLGIRAAAENLYWDLYAAERELAVFRLTREQAGALTKEAELRANAGLVGPNQVNNARVFLAQQELALLDAEDGVSRISDALASLIARQPQSANHRFRTVDVPPQIDEVKSVDSAVERALENNHELKAMNSEVAAMRALARKASWNAMPQADLFGAFGGNGLGGTGRDVIFGSDTLRNSMDTKFGDALNDALNRDYPSWTIGIRVNLPILLRENRGERNRLRGELVRAEQRLASARNMIEENVRAVHRELKNGQERVRAAQSGVTAAEDQVRIGVIEFKNGTTTAFELVRLGADYANVHALYSRALVRSAQAEARLRQLAPEETEK